MNNQTAACQPDCPDGPEAAAQQDALVNLVVQRLALAQDVAAAKYRTGASIDDSAREERLLQSAARTLNVVGSGQQIGMLFLRDQFESSKVIQRSLHHRWRLHPEEVPATNLDLAAEIRPRLDCITTRMIQLLKCGIPRIEAEDMIGALEAQFSEIAPEVQLPGLHVHAAVFAMRSLSAGCEAQAHAEPTV